MPRLGKIRLGIKLQSQSGSEYPKAVDYFVLPPELAERFGEKPRSLPIMFLTNDEPEQWYKAYSKSRGLVCRGDGEMAMALVDLETGDIAGHDAKSTELREVPCNPATCPVYQKKQCHRVMNLQFYVRGTELLGVYQLDTGSINGIININSSMAMVRAVAGQVAMVPMDLVVEPREVQPEGKKKTVYVLQLHVNMAEAMQVSQRRLGAPVVHALPPAETGQAPDDLYPDDIVAEEPTFKPEPRPEPKRKPGPKPKALRQTAKQSPETAAATPEPDRQPIAASDGPKPCSREAGSIHPETVKRVVALMNADETGLRARKLAEKKGWEAHDLGVWSEYQGQVIVAVCEGRDEADVV